MAMPPPRSTPALLASSGVDASDVQLQLQMNDGLLDILMKLSSTDMLEEADAARYMMHWHGLDPVQRVLTFSTLERLQGSDSKMRLATHMVKLAVQESRAMTSSGGRAD